MATRTNPTLHTELSARRHAGVQQQTGRAVTGDARLRQPASLADALALVGGQIREMTR